MTGTRVAVEFVVAYSDPQRATAFVERHLRRWLEYKLRGRFGMRIAVTPKIRTAKEGQA